MTSQELWYEQCTLLLGHWNKKEKFSDGERARILDLGCGPGVSTFALAKKMNHNSNVIGLDFSAPMITKALAYQHNKFPELKNVDFIQGNAMDLNFDDNSFDLITGHSFLYLIPDRDLCLSEAYRVLKPGGQLVFMEPFKGGHLSESIKLEFKNLKWSQINLTGFLFFLSMFFWRLFSSISGQLSIGEINQRFSQAGFDKISTHNTLSGLGIHCVATKPDKN